MKLTVIEKIQEFFDPAIQSVGFQVLPNNAGYSVVVKYCLRRPDVRRFTRDDEQCYTQARGPRDAAAVYCDEMINKMTRHKQNRAYVR